MSSADPSLSLPHQSHTVPPAHPVPPLPLFAVLYPRFPFSALITPIAERTVSSLRALRAFSLIVLSHSLLSLAPLRGPLFRCSPLANRPQLTLIYVIFSERPHVTALQRTLHQACPMRVRKIRGEYAVRKCNGGEGSEREGANQDKRGRSVESPNGHPWSPSGDTRNVNRTNQSRDPR